MIGIYRAFLVVALVVSTSTSCTAADKPKLVSRLELPYLDEGTRTLSGWVGFCPSGEFVAAYYSLNTIGQKNKLVESKDAYLAIWETAKGTLIYKTKIENGIPDGLYGPPATFTRDGKSFVLTTRDGVRFYSMTPSHETQAQAIKVGLGGSQEISDILQEDYFLNTDPLNNIIIRTSFCSAVRSMATVEIQLEPKLKLGKASHQYLCATTFTLASDNTLMAWTEEDPGKIRVKKVNRAKTEKSDDSSIKILNVPKPARDIFVLAFNRRNTLLASGSRDGTFIIWDLQGTRVQSLIRDPGDKMTITKVSFSPDERRVAYSNTYSKGLPNVVVASVQTGELRWQWSDNHTGVCCIAYESSGRELAVLGSTTVNIYDVAEEKR